MKIPLEAIEAIGHTELSYRASLTAYLAQRAAHRNTLNIPAPFPPHEFMRVIAERIERENDTPLEVLPKQPQQPRL